MPTLRQKALARALAENASSGNPKTKGEILVSIGYSPATATGIPKEIIEAKGTQEALIALGFTEGNAKMVVSEILMNPEEKAHDRLDAADKIFKFHGSYAPEKSENINYNLNRNIDPVQAALLAEYEEKLRGKLSDGVQ